MVSKVWGYKIVDTLPLSPTNGDFGIEIEMEMESPYTPSVHEAIGEDKDWRWEEDHSLKVNGVELVLRKPYTKKHCVSVINKLGDSFKKHKIHLHKSIRAGTHVHVNMQENTLEEVVNMALMYYIVESAMVRFSGEGREGNLFCLRAKDAPGIMSALEQCINKSTLMPLKSDKFRYASLNYQSLFSYGSLEFRSLNTESGFKNLIKWLDLIESLKNYSLKHKDPCEVLEKMSGFGSYDILCDIFGEEDANLLNHEGLEEDMYYDVRECQVAAYAFRNKVHK